MYALKHRDPTGKAGRVATERAIGLLGEATHDLLVSGSKGLRAPVPVLYPGLRAFAADGEMFSQIEGGGFSSLSDLIAEISGTKRQDLMFNKAGVAGVVGTAAHLWLPGSWPVAGAAGGTTGSGVARTSASQGAFTGLVNAAGGDTLHLIGGTFMGSIGTQILVLYDRLWDMTHTMTVSPRSTDGTAPSRYQGTESVGSFLTGEVTTVLPASSPTITFAYVDQGGANTTSPNNTIRASAAVNSSPFPLGQWFAQLDSADNGIRAFQNSANGVVQSVALASGVITWVIGHALAYIPIPTANVPVLIDGINSAMNLVRIYDNAALAFLEIKGATNATNWFGQMILCSG